MKKLTTRERFYGKGIFEITHSFHFIDEIFKDIKGFKEALLYNRFTASFKNGMLIKVRLQFYKESNILGIFIYDSQDLFLNYYIVKCPIQEQFKNLKEELNYYEHLGYNISQLVKINLVWIYTDFNELIYSARSHKYNTDLHPFFDQHLDYLKFSKKKLIECYEKHQKNFKNFSIKLFFKYDTSNFLLHYFMLGFLLNKNLKFIRFEQGELEKNFKFPGGVNKVILKFIDENEPILQYDYYYNRFYGFTLMSELFHPVFYRYVHILFHQRGLQNIHVQPIRSHTIKSVWMRYLPNVDLVKVATLFTPPYGPDTWMDYHRSFYWYPSRNGLHSNNDFNYLNYFISAFKLAGNMKRFFYYVPCFINLEVRDNNKIYDILSFHYFLKGLIFGGVRFLSFTCVKILQYKNYYYSMRIGFKYPSILNFKFRLKWLPKNNMLNDN
jgi:hypothetical protein